MKTWGAALSLSVMLACALDGQIRMVRKELAGGVLALEGDRDKAMTAARREMQTHCGSDYTITSEEEAVVGEEAETRATVRQTVRTVTSAVREIRITYQCGQVASSPGAVRDHPSTRPPALAKGRGGIEVNAETHGAEIWLDGAQTGQITPALLANLVPGIHEVEVRTPTHLGRVQVEVFEGAVVPLRIAAHEVRKLTLVLDTEPSGAKLELDGVHLGAGPQQIANASAGFHRVRATHTEHPPFEGSVQLTAPASTLRVPLPPPAANQLRIFPFPVLLEYDHRLQDRWWWGLQLSLGPILPTRELGTIGAGGGVTLVARYQTSPHAPFGLGVVTGVGSSIQTAQGREMQSPDGYVGVHVLAGGEVRYAFLTLNLDVLYLTPVTFNGNNGPFFLESPLVFRPSLSLVWSF